MYRIVLSFLPLAGGALANVLFQNATIISFDQSTEQFRILRQSSLLVEGDRISRIYEGQATGQNATGNLTIVDASSKIISPGFVDTHHHVWSTIFKTLGANSDLGTYFQRFGAPSPAGLEGGFTPDDTYISQLAGLLELMSEGTTTVVDFAHGCFSEEHTDETVRATLESGIRSFFSLAIMDFPNGYSSESQIQKLRGLADDPRFPGSNDRVSLGLAYDGFSIAPPDMIDTLWEITRKQNLSIVTTHYDGGPGDSAPRSPRLMNDLGWLNTTTPFIFAHADFVNEENRNLLRLTNQYISSTPESEFQFGIGNEYNQFIMDQGSLGIDTHLTFSTGMVQQARLWLQTLRNRNYVDVLEASRVPRGNPMSVTQAFSLITRHGGLALRRPDLGVIQEGAKADLVMFSTDSPAMLGWYDPIAAIILHSSIADIQDVLVDGQFVKRNHSLAFNDYAGFRQRYQVAANRIQQEWLAKVWEPLPDMSNDVGIYKDTEVIDTQRGNGTGY